MISSGSRLRLNVSQTTLLNGEPGVFFEITANSFCGDFELSEPEALSVALAILRVSIEIRDGRIGPYSQLRSALDKGALQ